MLDLNYLYVYATRKKKQGAITPVEYLNAQGLIKEEKQNFVKYYEGLFAQRVYECNKNPDVEINLIDIFSIILDEFDLTPQDVFDAMQNVNFEKNNIVDKLFYELMYYSRIFASFEEIRARGNKELFVDVTQDKPLRPYQNIATYDFMFNAPIVELNGKNVLREVVASLYTEMEGGNRIFLSENEQQLLLSVFDLRRYLDEYIHDDVNSNAIWDELCDIVGFEYDKMDVNDENVKDFRNFIYAEWLVDEFQNSNWEYSENFLNGLCHIGVNGNTRFTSDKDAQMITVGDLYKSDDVEAMQLEKEAKKEKAGRFKIAKKQCDTLRARIVGQNKQVDEILDKLMSVACGFCATDKPIGSFLMNGPTGVGKTETAKALADVFCEGRMFTVDMSTFKHSTDVARLVGSAPGFVGYDDKVGLIEFVRNNQNGVINFDEIDKCHSSCLTFLLSVLDEGKFITARGETLDVSDFIITATTNQKAEVNKNAENYNLTELVSRSGEESGPFLKEFLGRFDCILDYQELSKDDLREILSFKLQHKIDTFKENNKEKNITLSYEKPLLDAILQDANYKSTGARALNSSMQKLFVRPVAKFIVDNGELPRDSEITVGANGKLAINGEVRVNDEKTKPVQEKKEQKHTVSLYA